MKNTFAEVDRDEKNKPTRSRSASADAARPARSPFIPAETADISLAFVGPAVGGVVGTATDGHSLQGDVFPSTNASVVLRRLRFAECVRLELQNSTRIASEK